MKSVPEEVDTLGMCINHQALSSFEPRSMHRSQIIHRVSAAQMFCPQPFINASFKVAYLAPRSTYKQGSYTRHEISACLDLALASFFPGSHQLCEHSQCYIDATNAACIISEMCQPPPPPPPLGPPFSSPKHTQSFPSTTHIRNNTIGFAGGSAGVGPAGVQHGQPAAAATAAQVQSFRGDWHRQPAQQATG